MVRTWPSSLRRARLSARLAAEATLTVLASLVVVLGGAVATALRARPTMRTRPSSLPRRHTYEAVVGEVVLGVLLVSALAFSPHDAVPVDNPDDSIGPNVRYAVAPVEQPSFGLALPGLANLSSWGSTTGALVSAKAAKALIPTAPPAQLLIPALDVHRAVEAVGTNRFGVMDLPANGWNAGWYRAGPTPGAPGDAVIEGHAGYPDQPMMFGKLATLRRGDQVVVVLADGSKRLFLVESMSTVAAGVAPPGLGEPFGLPRLTLITCTGHFDDHNHFYSQRLMVELSYSGVV
jgi:Sortase domain